MVCSILARVLCALFCVGCLLPADRVHAAPFQLFASQFELDDPNAEEDLLSINPTNAAPTVVGKTGYFNPGMDFNKIGTLYGVADILMTLDTTTGLSTEIAPVSELMVALAFSPANELFAINNSGSKLFKLDPVTGATLSSVTITGTVSLSGDPLPGEIGGIDFAPDGTLYGAGAGLYTINPTTGEAVRITPLGTNITGTPRTFRDLDYGADGKLRGVDISPLAISTLYEINTLTGLGTAVGPIGPQVWGLASVPEPSTCALATVGFAALLALRWRRSLPRN